MTVSEEARLDKPLTVPHQIVAEEAGVNTVSSPPTHAISHADHVRVPLGLLHVVGVPAGAGVLG